MPKSNKYYFLYLSNNNNTNITLNIPDEAPKNMPKLNKSLTNIRLRLIGDFSIVFILKIIFNDN